MKIEKKTGIGRIYKDDKEGGKQKTENKGENKKNCNTNDKKKQH